MPVWRVTINNVRAKRTPGKAEGITVEVKPALKEAKVEKAGKADLIKVEYGLKANYKPGVGSIDVGGHIFFIGLDPKEVMEDDRISDPEIVRQAYQRIFVEPMVAAIDLAKEMKLPLPVRMPEVSIKGPAVEKKDQKTKETK